MSFGIDYAWSRPTITAMQKAGVTFVCRYASHDTTGKNLSRTEAEDLSAAGFWLVLVWETSAKRALDGEAAGRADASDALSAARKLGMPEDRPIFFAVDFDATAAQQPMINAYLDGAAAVIGVSRMGIYAGYGPLVRAFESGKVTYGWQTYAWSGGKWDGRAGIQQYSNGETVGGQDVDYNRSTRDDFGQWKVGESPMALSAEDKKWILDNVGKAVLNADNVIKAGDGNTANPYWTLQFHVFDINTRIRSLQAAVAALAGTTPDVDESAIVAGVLAGLNFSPETMAEQIAAHMGTDMATQLLNALRARLES